MEQARTEMTKDEAARAMAKALKTLRLVLRLAALKYDFDLTGSAAMEESESALEAWAAAEGEGK